MRQEPCSAAAGIGGNPSSHPLCCPGQAPAEGEAGSPGMGITQGGGILQPCSSTAHRTLPEGPPLHHGQQRNHQLFAAAEELLSGAHRCSYLE